MIALMGKQNGATGFCSGEQLSKRRLRAGSRATQEVQHDRFSTLVWPNPLSWQCDVRRDCAERFAEDPKLRTRCPTSGKLIEHDQPRMIECVS
jgi:hypothetical protein